MAKDTRAAFIESATALFSEKGFYGVSLAAIADALGLTKQALLHHFGSKEKLYGEVLQATAARMMSQLEDATQSDRDAVQQLSVFFTKAFESAVDDGVDTQLLMRELLDNKRRAETAANWYLQPFLDHLTNIVLSIPGNEEMDQPAALAAVYSLLGALNYFVISEPTLRQMYGAEAFRALKSAYGYEMSALIAARFGSTC